METLRLINQFIPEHYDLSLDINEGARKFSGTLTLHGTSTQDELIKLHTKDLTVTNATINGRTAEIAHSDNDELHLTQQGLSAGNQVLVLGFTGDITAAMHGLYPSHFTHDGQTKTLFATQFESHHAREVFPSIDEPEAKATFDLTLTTAQGQTVLSNQPIDYQRVENDRLVTSFQTSPRMSTYLLAWVVGELHKKTAFTKEGIEVNVWATPAQPPESLEFPLDIAVRTIEFYNDYFDTPYPLTKSDHVALPDFSSGAMENWGLITYREIALLANPATTSISSKQYIATVIAHELAHQWFGNLVTMKWWNDLWLNESFATLMEYIAIDALHPEWNIWLDFASNESVAALRRDAMQGVQPVQVDVNHPDEISTLFDPAIVYAKGARLLAMLRSYVGDEAFQAGLKQYFLTYAYANTEAEDLWNVLAAASGKPVPQVMEGWLSHPGYPLVRATRDGQTVTFTQHQFFVGEHTESEIIWPIPLNTSDSEAPELLTEATTTYTTSAPLVHLNQGNASHFITSYDAGMTAAILEQVSNGTLNEIDRLAFLNEATLLARGGVLTSADLIPIIRAFRNETSEPVWGVISLALGELRKFVENDHDAEQALKQLSADLARPLYTKLGWTPLEGESPETQKLRALILALTLYGENPEAIEAARTAYDQGLEHLDPELRAIIASSVVKHDDTGDIAAMLLEKYAATQDGELAQDICSALTSTRMSSVITDLLAAIKDSSIVRPQDTARWFAYLMRNRYARSQTWNWLQNNWDWITDTFGGDKSYDDYPRLAAMGLMTAEELDSYQIFFVPLRRNPALNRVIVLGINEIKARVSLIDTDGPAVLAALRNLPS